MPTISGVTKDASGNPVTAFVRAYRRDNGVLVGQAVSDSGTGAYSITTIDTSPHVVTRLVAPVTAGNTNWSNVGLLLPLNDSPFSDLKGNSVTNYGTARVNTVSDPFGGSDYYAQFSGYSKLEVANSSSVLPGAGDFTVRFKFLPTTTGRMGLFAYGADYYMGMDFHYNGSQNVNMWASSTGYSWDMVQSDTGGANHGIGAISLTMNVWNDIEMTRSGNTFRSFVNGVKDREVTASGTIYEGTQPFRVGMWGNAGFGLTGCISDFMFIKGVALHTASFTPPSTRTLGGPTPGTPTENAQIFDYVTPV